jgi:hypothetical protein
MLPFACLLPHRLQVYHDVGLGHGTHGEPECASGGGWKRVFHHTSLVSLHQMYLHSGALTVPDGMLSIGPEMGIMSLFSSAGDIL